MKNTSLKRVGITLIILLTSQSLPISTGNQRIVMAQAEVAMVAQLEGSMQLQRGGSKRVIRQTMLLNAGDVINAGNGGRAVIYQAYAPVTRIEAGQSRTIKQLSPPPPQNALRPEEFARLKRHYLNAKLKRNEPSPATMGGPDESVLTLLEPRHSLVLESRPTFVWTAVSDATRYVITVYDQNEETIWTANTTETIAIYPADRPLLPPGNYKWDVIAQVGTRTTDNPALYDATAFTVISEGRTAEIKNDLARARASIAADAVNLVYISALIEHKQLTQASVELKASLERVPQDQTLWELLMDTFSQMKLWRAREDARKISDSANPTVDMVRTLALRR